jgi:UDP-N-acetyl-D-galactosamine dehydrogenase
MKLVDKKIAIIGLGYVGLPLAVEFGKKYCTIGFDINAGRVNELKNNIDITKECSQDELKQATLLSYTTDLNELKTVDIYIVTVPTPVDKHFKPDLTPLIKASQMLGKVVTQGNIVIYESTVYPGATEDDCIPEIERISGLKYNVDFFAGYSPERINPGDKINRLTTIKKVTSGSSSEIAKIVDELYKSIIEAGTFPATSIRVAEAAKVIENTQRDVNIALMNEFAMMFNRMNINTFDVLEAAGTKWNFIKLQPGLVGGHCIGVDPYYLLQKANEYNYAPDMIRSAREINNNMAGFVCSQIIDNMVLNSIDVPKSRLLILGGTFKENCPDIRNTKVIELYKALKKYGIAIDIYDPLLDPEEFFAEYQVKVLHDKPLYDYDVIALIVPHEEFLKDKSLLEQIKSNGFIYDLKSKFSQCGNKKIIVL